MQGMSQCCVAGEIHTGTPTGTVKNVHGLDCYVAEPPSGNVKGVVVIIPDAFGWKFNNNRILADDYAKKGEFQVYLPELMGGWAPPPSLEISFKAMSATGLWANLMKFYHALFFIRYFLPFMFFNRATVTRPKICNFMKALRAHEAANQRVGVAGFCWGGKWVTVLSWDEDKTDDGKSLIDCAFMAHPSMLAFPDDIEKIRKPMSVAAAEHDMAVGLDQYEMTRRILEEKTKKDQGEHEYRMYKGAHHGFAVRGSETDPEESQRGLEAETQAINWFKKWLGA